MQVWQEIQQQIEAKFGCEHTHTEIRFKITTAGLRQYWRQCLRCGRNRGAVRKTEVGNPDRVRPFDEGLDRDFCKEQSDFRQELYAAKRQAEQEQWFEDHDEYLRTPAWRAKRKLVLERDRFKCQARLSGCTEMATQVHHLSYSHWRNEPLFELASVCSECHRAITRMDRGRRGAA